MDWISSTVASMRSLWIPAQWESLLDQIGDDDSRNWEPLPASIWNVFKHSDAEYDDFCIETAFRVHGHPDPFLSRWERYFTSPGWSHAGSHPDSVVRTHGAGLHQRFLTSFAVTDRDLWCGDYGIEKPHQYRSKFQFPRLVSWAAQTSRVGHYLRGYQNTDLYFYFHEVAVSRRTHPIRQRWILRKQNSKEVTQLSENEIEQFDRLGGTILGTDSVPRFVVDARPLISVEEYSSWAEPAEIGAHPVAFFFGYLLTAIADEPLRFRNWLALQQNIGTAAACIAITTNPRCFVGPGLSMCRVVHVGIAFGHLDQHLRNLEAVVPQSAAKFGVALIEISRRIMAEIVARSGRLPDGSFLKEVAWKFDCYVTSGLLPTANYPITPWEIPEEPTVV